MTKSTSSYAGLNTRYPREKIERFESRAKLLGKTKSEMLRTLADAFIEGRLNIIQTPVERHMNEGTFK